MKIVPVVFVLLLSAVCYSEIFLSEIMFNPQGNERYNEFIELYNSSRSETIDLNGWLIGDADRTSCLLAYNEHTLLAPGQFALVLVENYFINSTEYDNQIPQDCLILTINHSQIGAYGLSNTRAETVFLYKPDSTMIDSFQYTIPNDDGISEERIRYDQNSWGHSTEMNGTPGYKNSIALKAIDPAIVKGSLNMLPNPPLSGQPLNLEITVTNKGAQTIDAAELVFSWSYHQEGPYQNIKDEIIFSMLEPDESATLGLEWTDFPNGIFYVTAELECDSDENPDNNLDSLQIIGGYPRGSVIVNEIMYSPQPDMPEWFEIYNTSQIDINLQNWMYYDNQGDVKTFTHTPFWLPSQSFAVIADDSTIVPFLSQETNVLVPLSFPGLVNDADSIVLRDATGSLVEYVEYFESWGGAKGISLERLNPGSESNEYKNWKSCVNTNGHTAGLPNSIYTDVLPTATSIKISPSPFSPDGDGYQDFAGINYNLPEHASKINIRIFDSVGRQVRYLCNNESCAAQGTVFWDGLDDEGICCRMGIYIVLLECIETGKGIAEKQTGTLVLARNL